MLQTRPRWSLISALAVLALLPPPLANAQEAALWTAIDPADLKLQENPKEPGGQAMVLDYWDDTNNLKSDETVRIRIKILREEGKKYANVEIPYLEKYMQLEDLHARTVSPDGQSTVSDAAVYDREIVRAKRYKLNAKTLTLANVQVHSIIEYTYRMHWKKGISRRRQASISVYLHGANRLPGCELGGTARYFCAPRTPDASPVSRWLPAV